MKTFLKDGFSLNEFKVSSLIVALVVFSGIGIYSFFKEGDIPPNLVSVLSTLVVTVGGANVFMSLLDSFTKEKDGE